MTIVLLHVLFDGGDQFRYRAKDRTSQLVLGQVTKEAFDHVEPGGAGGREMHVKSRVLGKPRLYLGMLMGGIVVSDQMQLLVLGRVAIDLAQEAQPLLVTMFCLALANDTAIERVHRGKQRRHTMALVIVRHRLSATSLQRQARLGPVKRPDPALLVAAQDQGVLRGIEIQPDDVLEFLDEVLIVRYLEARYAMRL